jgi:hypothetical protein
MLWFILSSWLFAGSGLAQDLPIFDAHIHYSRPAWEPYSPEAALSILDRAGVSRALVSSTPDDGTLRLYEKAPWRIVPFLRPYRSREDMAGWTKNLDILAYVEERLKRGIYRGIGEFHIGPGDAASPVIVGLHRLAASRKLFLHAHTDEVAVEELLRLQPEVPVLWAHAGMVSSPETVGRLLDRYQNLWVELALRLDVAPEGRLDPVWRSLFLRFPDRFMVGTDTWVNSQWEALPEILNRFRVWLRQLPPEVASKVASENAERLFGGKAQ